MKNYARRSKARDIVIRMAGLCLVGIAGFAEAEPLTGPEFDKIMVLSENGDGPGISVGQFAGCANDRIEALIDVGARPRSTPKVSGELTEDRFVVTVPGEQNDILFHFVSLDGNPDQLLLAIVSIGGAEVTSYNDKIIAIGVLIPDCL